MNHSQIESKPISTQQNKKNKMKNDYQSHYEIKKWTGARLKQKFLGRNVDLDAFLASVESQEKILR